MFSLETIEQIQTAGGVHEAAVQHNEPASILKCDGCAQWWPVERLQGRRGDRRCPGCDRKRRIETRVGLVEQIMAFEDGQLDDAETVELFQGLIDSGLAWKLQGVYGRTAAQLIEAGACHTTQEVSP